MELEQRTGLLFDFELRFPPLSRTVAEVSDLLATNGMPDTDRLIEIVHLDPLVVASVLRRINSAFYGMRRQFHDIRKAILMIGFIEVCNIVLASGYVGMRRSIQSAEHSDLIDRIMRVSIGSGFYSNLLAHHLNLAEKASAFTGGLLHSIGRFVLLYNVPDQYLQTVGNASEIYIPTSAQEREIVGVDHTAVGSIAAQHWNFPPLITSMIESYLSPGHLATDEQRKLALTLSTSVDIACELNMAYDAVKNTVEVEDSENPLENFPIPFQIKTPRSLELLARNTKTNPADLMQVVEENQKEALHYVELMSRA